MNLRTIDMSEWIECTKRLPEKPGRYLIFEMKGEHAHNCLAFNYPYPCCKPNIAYFKCYQEEDWQWNSSVDMKCNPTHWMQIPNPPEKQVGLCQHVFTWMPKNDAMCIICGVLRSNPPEKQDS